MHLLGTSVLTLIILPLAFCCGQNKHQITEDYRNIIVKELKHLEASIEQLNSNCTVGNAGMSKPKNTQQSIHREICRVNGKLRRVGRESEVLHKQLKDLLAKVVDGVNESLRCWCHQKTGRPTQRTRKWKLCKVKDILANLQTYFEQYNAFHSLSTDLPEREKTSEKTGI